MAKNDFLRFCSEYLPQQPALQKELDTLTDVRKRAEAMVAAGHKAGFTFSAAEAEAALQTSEQRIRQADAELTGAKHGPAAATLALQEATQMDSRKFQSIEPPKSDPTRSKT